jgi:hypothetical protein
VRPQEPRRSEQEADAVMQRVDLEEIARLDECEIIEFIKVAKDFPEYFG